jgi:hypothetical protein
MDIWAPCGYEAVCVIIAHLSSYFRDVDYFPRAVNFDPITQAAEVGSACDNADILAQRTKGRQCFAAKSKRKKGR